MGRQIIIKGADFSQNSLNLGFSEEISKYFYPRQALGVAWGTKTDMNTRCCVLKADLSQYVDMYRYIRVRIRSEFDYVAAVGLNAGSYYKNDLYEAEFVWVTNSNLVVMPLSEDKPYMSLNFRHKDNTTEFAADASLADIVEEIILF